MENNQEQLYEQQIEEQITHVSETYDQSQIQVLEGQLPRGATHLLKITLS